MALKRNTIVCVYSAGVILIASSCSSMNAISPGSAEVVSRMNEHSEGIAIHGYGSVDGARYKFDGRVTAYGDTLLFSGIQKSSPPANWGLEQATSERVTFLVPRDSVAFIEVKQLNVGKTAWLAVGLLAAWALGVLIYWTSQPIL